jgi:hypothetical protein
MRHKEARAVGRGEGNIGVGPGVMDSQHGGREGASYGLH